MNGCTCSGCEPSWHCHQTDNCPREEESCKCDKCTYAAHCQGNKWIYIIDGHGNSVGLCPLHSEFSLSQLMQFPVRAVGQADDLRFDNGRTRIWLSRCDENDGEEYKYKVTVESLRTGGVWQVYTTYQALR